MNQEDYNLRVNTIKNTFNETREIKCLTPPEDRIVSEGVYPGGDIFTTEDGELIDLEIQTTEFDECELVKYIEFAEDIYENNSKKVSIYIICPESIDISVKECNIYSEAEFTIKLALVENSIEETILNVIKNKRANNEELTEEDIEILAKLSTTCKKEDRNYYRKEYFRIISGKY